MKPIRIGVLAAATERSIHAIPWYEQMGLLPGVERDAGGRRLYKHDHIDWLGFLDRLQFSGLTVKEMQTYARLVSFGIASVPERHDLLSRHRHVVAERLAELSKALALIDWKIAFYDDWGRTGIRPTEAHRPPIRRRHMQNANAG